MIDLISLWIGRFVIVASGVCLCLLAAGLVIDWIWYRVRYHAYFLDCLAIYMRKGRQSAIEKAESLPRQPYH